MAKGLFQAAMGIALLGSLTTLLPVHARSIENKPIVLRPKEKSLSSAMWDQERKAFSYDVPEFDSSSGNCAQSVRAALKESEDRINQQLHRENLHRGPEAEDVLSSDEKAQTWDKVIQEEIQAPMAPLMNTLSQICSTYPNADQPTMNRIIGKQLYAVEDKALSTLRNMITWLQQVARQRLDEKSKYKTGGEAPPLPQLPHSN